MAEILKKKFLDYEGLKLYDELIKKLIKDSNSNVEALAEYLGTLPENAPEGSSVVEYLLNALKDVDDKVGDLSKLTPEGEEEGQAFDNVVDALLSESERAAAAEKKLQDAIDKLLADAPEAFDTLKEIADWISADEEGAVALVQRVMKAEQDIEDAKAECENRFNSIGAIEKLQIVALFPVEQAEGEPLSEALESLPEGEALKMQADQEISEDIVIEHSCYIDANGSTFSGVVTVPADKDVVIVNATFANPVVVK